MTRTPIRLAVRALILHRDRLLLVNAYPGGQSDLWCAPGGGAEPGASLADNLAREVWEETGLSIAAERPAGINEFHDPGSGFHQVDIFFHARISGGALDPAWADPEAVVSRRRFFARAELGTIRFKPDTLPRMAFDGAEGAAAVYDGLERLVR
ncbi:NUDIX domain-containing protein [Rhodobacteraceae bacterium 2CG4]|uniref:NUDIX domain-containing protein n=1 Tax=Halovulum marinum TaxID=2662447 RepID=A0A6L5Z0P3_9RHOB|nr:NUDIX hydrolase [Halovulum marinum]MSU89670.1 NUDIX domain-containing protein [Halovulum marinum]